jgi:hypothetical protein
MGTAHTKYTYEKFSQPAPTPKLHPDLYSQV